MDSVLSAVLAPSAGLCNASRSPIQFLIRRLDEEALLAAVQHGAFVVLPEAHCSVAIPDHSSAHGALAVLHLGHDAAACCPAAILDVPDGEGIISPTGCTCANAMRYCDEQLYSLLLGQADTG